MKLSRLSLCVVAAALMLGGCLKKAFDTPLDTSQYDPALPVQASLKNMSNLGIAIGNGKSRVLGDTTVYGVVVADDRSGNYYKQIVIQDTSLGGIVVYIDKSYLYADYPVGRGLYIKLKGLYLVNYKGLPEIVYSVDAAGNTTAIPSGLVNNYIVKGKYPDNSVSATSLSLLTLTLNTNKYINTLVKINDVQFDGASKGVSYALPSSVASGTDRFIEVCDHTIKMTVRTSGYCNFQPYLTPTGKGSLTCIVSNYGGVAQLIVRDTTDANMLVTRCP